MRHTILQKKQPLFGVLEAPKSPEYLSMIVLKLIIWRDQRDLFSRYILVFMTLSVFMDNFILFKTEIP